MAKNVHQTLSQFEEDLHKNETEFSRILEMVSEQEMNIYHDMMVLEQVQKKNERTREVMTLGQSKMSVIEESQKYMLNMLDELETDLSKMLALSRSDLTPLYEDQDMQPNSQIKLTGSSNEARLYQKLDKVSNEMRKNDELISECMKKMQIMDNIEQE